MWTSSVASPSNGACCSRPSTLWMLAPRPGATLSTRLAQCWWRKTRRWSSMRWESGTWKLSRWAWMLDWKASPSKLFTRRKIYCLSEKLKIFFFIEFWFLGTISFQWDHIFNRYCFQPVIKKLSLLFLNL